MIKTLVILIVTVVQLVIPYRADVGTVTARQYVADGDYMCVTIETDDGNTWHVDDYTAPLGARVVVLYDDMGTAALEDDEIRYIISVNEI